MLTTVAVAGAEAAVPYRGRADCKLVNEGLNHWRHKIVKLKIPHPCFNLRGFLNEAHADGALAFGIITLLYNSMKGKEGHKPSMICQSDIYPPCHK
ncbi:uncharacterized protein [Triticum aestivum]|uniref:uncharacterized protein isoform X2 n=1 Tax=Triticum aestivum TaxID=4565 RepID=UPI001D0341FE|nr:uncharacterized protein LOC123088423 isoform X2 [Triticum aestivum]